MPAAQPSANGLRGDDDNDGIGEKATGRRVSEQPERRRFAQGTTEGRLEILEK